MILNERKYKLIEDYRNAFDEEEVKKKFTDFFNQYDYVIGDWAYGSLRLKGFCKKNNKILNEINDFSNKDKYIKEQCVVDSKYFILEKEE